MNRNPQDQLKADEKRMREPRKSSAYAYTPARPFLTYRKSVSPLPREVSNPVEVEKLICEFLFDQDQVRFLPAHRALKIASLQPKTENGDIGLLFRDFRLAEIRSLIGRANRSEAEDTDILSCLDKLASARKLKVINAEISKWTHFSDCSFCAEVGVAVQEICSPWTIPKLWQICWYLDKPLDKSNYAFGGRAIENVTERVQKLRARRDQVFRSRFGWKDLGLESALHRQDVMDDIKLKEAILSAARKLDSDKTDK
jgi:hypothetical protein